MGRFQILFNGHALYWIFLKNRKFDGLNITFYLRIWIPGLTKAPGFSIIYLSVLPGALKRWPNYLVANPVGQSWWVSHRKASSETGRKWPVFLIYWAMLVLPISIRYGTNASVSMAALHIDNCILSGTPLPAGATPAILGILLSYKKSSPTVRVIIPGGFLYSCNQQRRSNHET
jgi:hypothetical protein